METANDKNTISVGTKESLSELPPPPRETINHPPLPLAYPVAALSLETGEVLFSTRYGSRLWL